MKIWKCCKLNMMQWRIQPKFLLVLLYIVLCTWKPLAAYKDFAVAAGFKLAPWILVGLTSAGRWFMFHMLSYILLISDAPFLNRQQQFVLQRTGKVTWLAGQFLYLVVLSALITILTWVLSVLALMPEIDWTTEWGVGLQSAARHSGVFPVYPPFTINLYVLKNMTGMGATLWVLLMQFLIGLFLGELVLVCNLWTKRGVGISISAALVCLSTLVSFYAGTAGNIKKLVFVSPLSWMDLALTGDTAIGQPSLWYCLIVLLTLIIGMTVFALCNIHKHSLDTMEE